MQVRTAPDTHSCTPQDPVVALQSRSVAQPSLTQLEPQVPRTKTPWPYTKSMQQRSPGAQSVG